MSTWAENGNLFVRCYQSFYLYWWHLPVIVAQFEITNKTQFIWTFWKIIDKEKKDLTISYIVPGGGVRKGSTAEERLESAKQIKAHHSLM